MYLQIQIPLWYWQAGMLVLLILVLIGIVWIAHLQKRNKELKEERSNPLTIDDSYVGKVFYPINFFDRYNRNTSSLFDSKSSIVKALVNDSESVYYFEISNEQIIEQLKQHHNKVYVLETRTVNGGKKEFYFKVINTARELSYYKTNFSKILYSEV